MNLEPITIGQLKTLVGQRLYLHELQTWATIKSINVGPNGVQFEVAWFSNGAPYSAWTFAHQLSETRHELSC